MSDKNDMKYDIVFWAHGHNETERYLPLMVSLKERGIKTVLFYQNYNYRDGLSVAQQEIIQKFGLNILDYSYFLKNDLFLAAITIFVEIFKHVVKIPFLYNKFIGARSKLIGLCTTEEFIRKIVLMLKPKLNIFDTISLTGYKNYPYGSYFIKRISDQMKIKSFSVLHGISGYIVTNANIKKTLDFDKIYVANEHEKRLALAASANSRTKVMVFGDPRFDNNWKNEMLRMFSDKVDGNIKKMNIDKKLKILYLCPNLEQINEEDEKYRNLADITRLSKELPGTALMIRPHPRYRGINKIRKIMKRYCLKDFFILENEPAICYLKHIDFFITLSTSALYDILPLGHHKVIIHDDFTESAGFVNIFKDNFNYFRNYNELYRFIRSKTDEDKAPAAGYTTDQEIELFCRKWVAGGSSLDTIIKNIVDDIYRELKEQSNE